MVVVIRPQPGPQEKALACDADIIFLGGAKGGGKSYALRLAPVPHLSVPGFHSVIFRRSRPQLTKPGGQWDKSYEIYRPLGGKDHKSLLRWSFLGGSTVTFSHLADDKDWLDWQGTETAMYGFDQLEEFTQEQFLKILGCMRTTSGVQTQLWATMNPAADTWLAEFVAPWLAEDGYVDLLQDGTVKHFTVIDNNLTWVLPSWRDTNNQPPKSVAYFSADIWDNPALMLSDPNYLSSLQTQSLVDRERFLGKQGRGGNWHIKPTAGKVFRSEWFLFLQTIPALSVVVSFWDFAATEKENQGDDPDFTARVKLGLTREGGLLVLDVIRFQDTPDGVNRKLWNVASQDGRICKQRWQRDPGQAGVSQDYALRQLLTGYDALGAPSTLSKYERAKPASAAAEQGKIFILEAHWNRAFLAELEQFPDGDHDDQVDALAGAYNFITGAIASPTKTGKAKW